MNVLKYRLIVPIVLFFYLLVSGYNIINPLPLTYDPAMHASIATHVIPENIIPSTWEPLADVSYTYPPLFHWIAYAFWSKVSFSLSGIGAYQVVLLMGLFLYALFPVSCYIFGSAFGKKEAILFSFFGAVQASLMEVFAAGEYPQLLSMALLPIFFYFFVKKEFPKAGLIAGLILLTHVFTALYLVSFVILYLLISRVTKYENIKLKDLTILFLVFAIVSVIWIPKYIQITDNAINHRWENTQWYYSAGFMGLEKFNDMFLSMYPGSRMGIIILFLSLVGMGYSYKRNPLLVYLFAFTALFTIFHIPGTQYKFPDMLAIAIPPIASMGVLRLSKKISKLRSLSKVLLIGFFSLFLIINPYTNSLNLKNCCVSEDIPDDTEIRAAEQLKSEPVSRILVDERYEAWFSLIAGKYPMDPRVSDLEVFTDNYKQMITDREKIIDKINNAEDPSNLLVKWDVTHVVTRKDLKSTEFSLVYEEDGIKVYKRSI